MRLRGSIGAILRQGLMLLVCVISLYPIWFVIQTALKTHQDYTLNPTGLPTHPTLQNITNVLFHLPIPRWALNSALVTLSSVAISAIFALLAGYAIVFGSVRGREFLLRVNIGLMVVPPVTLLVPMFVLMVNLGLINTLRVLLRQLLSPDPRGVDRGRDGRWRAAFHDSAPRRAAAVVRGGVHVDDRQRDLGVD